MEINTRVNYPVKVCLNKMDEQGQVDMECPLHKFYVSWLAIRVCCVGTKLVVQAWNDHPVPGNYSMFRNCIVHYTISEH